jgi:hypothetical protein
VVAEPTSPRNGFDLRPTVLVAHLLTDDEKITGGRMLGVAIGFSACWY